MENGVDFELLKLQNHRACWGDSDLGDRCRWKPGSKGKPVFLFYLTGKFWRSNKMLDVKVPFKT